MGNNIKNNGMSQYFLSGVTDFQANTDHYSCSNFYGDYDVIHE